jgi:hypothetical protein
MHLRDTLFIAVRDTMKLSASVSKRIYSNILLVLKRSSGKGTTDERLTYLLRPNVTRPDRRAPAALETPPVTDIDYSSNPETDDNIDSDFISEHEMDSDIEMDRDNKGLPAIEESPNPSPFASLPIVDEDAWSHVEGEVTGGESDHDELDSNSEFGSASVDFLQPRLEALSIQSPPALPRSEAETLPCTDFNIDPDRTITEIHQHPLHDSASPQRRDWASGVRSPSSPSRSPVRTWPSRRRRNAKKRMQITGISDPRSFYEYLFL